MDTRVQTSFCVLKEQGQELNETEEKRSTSKGKRILNVKFITAANTHTGPGSKPGLCKSDQVLTASPMARPSFQFHTWCPSTAFVSYLSNTTLRHYETDDFCRNTRIYFENYIKSINTLIRWNRELKGLLTSLSVAFLSWHSQIHMPLFLNRKYDFMSLLPKVNVR